MILNAHASHPSTQTYVLKLHRDASPRQGLISGRLEHVASGHQFPFTTGEELIACLIRAAELAESAMREAES